MTATTVAMLAASAAFAAFMIHLTAGTTPHASNGSQGGQVTRQAARAEDRRVRHRRSSHAGGQRGGDGAARAVHQLGLVPNVATAIDSDGSLVTVGTNGTVYVWDMTARQVTSETAAPRGADFQRAAISPGGGTEAVQARGGTTYILQGQASPADTLPACERLYPGSVALSGLTIATGDAAGTGVDVWAASPFRASQR